jgi:BirA family biotin operon repressor/biotin-[acetyl-CoA-carboxylase] ligase
MALDPFSITLFDEVSSTNDTVLEAAARGEPEGTTHIALAQTAGRGRADHRWWSPRGAGLWMSTLLRPALPRERWAGLALVAGAGIHDALSALGVREVELEWPNDVVVRGRKLGGVLCEARSRGRDAWIALGIGVNLDLGADASSGTERRRRAVPPELAGKITCCTMEGPPATKDPENVGRAILLAFWRLYERYQNGEPLGPLVGHLLSHAGRAVKVSLPNASILEGTIAGLGPLGELLVDDGLGTLHTVVAGDVEYR